MAKSSANEPSEANAFDRTNAATEASFVEHVIAVVEAIPPGTVMTYGEVAATLGSRGARTVGQVMARYGSDLPWWRVIRAGGHPPTGHEAAAREHYRAESTPMLPTNTTAGYRVDLKRARRADRLS